MMPRRDLCAGLAAVLITVGLAACSVVAQRAPAPAPRAPAPANRLPPPPPDLDSIPDAVPRTEPRSLLGNPPFYDVLGLRYAVLASAAGYVERGIASWYGPAFHGANTSSGEIYDMYAMTAAHKTLPLPCYVRVTNLGNGRSVVVRVNDRGPFVADRIIDLSYAAALKLDLVRAGTARVEVRAIEPRPADARYAALDPRSAAGGMAQPAAGATPVPAAPVPGTAKIYVQAGAFAQSENAERLAARLRAAGVANAAVGAKQSAARTLFRVRVGPIASVAEFDLLLAKLAALGIPDARLALD
jgi:rare lipoprotein A